MDEKEAEARPVMGTIFLVVVLVVLVVVVIGRAKRAPHWGVQSRFRVVCRSVCMYVCLSWSKKRRRKYVGQTRAKRAHAQSQYWAVKSDQ